MNDHDVAESRTIDSGTRLVCACGAVYAGHDARERHTIHRGIELSRAALNRKGRG